MLVCGLGSSDGHEVGHHVECGAQEGGNMAGVQVMAKQCMHVVMCRDHVP